MDEPSSANSNTVARTAAIVEYLASHPRQTFTLSQLARFCDIKKSTAYKILGTLHQLGWVTRSPTDLRYGLGPTLITIGQAAEESRPEVNLARPIMERLSVAFQRECVLSTALWDEILVLEVVGGTMRRGGTYPGQRVPLITPFGTVFVAWQDTALRQQWYSRSSVVSAEEITVVERLLEATRQRGYVVTLHSDPRDRMAQIVRAVATERTIHDVRRIVTDQLAQLPALAYLMDSNPGASKLKVESFQAPVLDTDGAVRYAVSIGDIDSELDLETIAKCGSRVRKAANEVAAAIDLLSR